MLPYEELENKYSEFVGTKHACATNTGTSALHLAIEALKVTEKIPNDAQVIVPEFTMYASAMAVYYSRLQPVFIDCDDNLLINLDLLEKHFDLTVNKWKTKIIIVTHVYGRIVDMDRVRWIANKNNCRIIEDACEAQGAMLPKPELRKNKMVGSFDIGCWSFYKNKIISAEEGGMITTDDENLIKIASDMKSMSFGDRHDYQHDYIGFNYRMPDSQAKLALDSLKISSDSIEKRNNICEIYNDIIPQKFQMPNNRKVVWIYDMKHPKKDKAVEEILKAGYIVRHGFKPMSTQPIFNHWDKGKNAEKLSKEVFYSNIDINLTIDQHKIRAFHIKEILNDI